ncbi:MAG: hypothetical protein QW620_04480 [Thermoplasmata archaeon]
MPNLLIVDYVINSQLGITIVGKGVVRKKIKPYMKVDVEMYSAHAPKCVWSAEIPKRKPPAIDTVMSSLSSVVKDYGIEVPAEVDLVRVSSMSIFKELGFGGLVEYKANFGELGIEAPIIYEKLADAIATKLKMDMGI